MSLDRARRALGIEVLDEPHAEHEIGAEWLVQRGEHVVVEHQETRVAGELRLQ